jgi:hypothetical protein
MTKPCKHYSQECQKCLLADVTLQAVESYCKPMDYPACAVYKCFGGIKSKDTYCDELSKVLGIKRR